ncbi:hypothetical protein JJD41_00955 [Oxynema sp. CENA135]|uniref:ATPase, T2SS/T4P/T4SS family n=1 Tax=Oxynema sp. CENA135 TaxID=984206 RepID=UPI0019098785|nr:hypothetical protein [Oxynema sp. CENA135]MBK4728462.1 hypothetical protein [Oxynema sp. CENA135]
MQSNSETERANPMDTDRIFQLIDNILPFEACLYYEVLPLSINGSRLLLGMVDLEDTAALDYVRRLLGYMKCSLVPKQIDATTHRSVLTSYLNHTHTSAEQKASVSPPKPEAKHASPPMAGGSSTHRGQSAVVLNRLGQLVNKPSPPPKPPTLPQPPKLPPPHPDAEVPVLEISASHLDSPLEVIASLPPKQLLQELLGRVLTGGIGRLYFERQAEYGRILWSQDGVVQSVLDRLDLSLFQSVINELKRLTHLPLLPVEKPRQIEIERRYQGADLLLRLRVMPSDHGEDATLQVLRGAALKFYQQQQLVTLSRDALRLAQQLQRKVDELHKQAGNHPKLLEDQPLEALPALDQLLKQVDRQLDVLRHLETKD